MKMSKAILQSIVVFYRPEPTIRSKQHICLDRVTTFQKYTDYWKSMDIQFVSIQEERKKEEAK